MATNCNADRSGPLEDPFKPCSMEWRGSNLFICQHISSYLREELLFLSPYDCSIIVGIAKKNNGINQYQL